jgi:N-acyl-D-aspartate/D-glutamate deacylase
VREALDAGYLGLSIDMLPWHRWDGDAYKGMSVPSQQAGMPEYSALADVVREAGGILQATPNALKKETVARIFRLSMSGLGKKALKTTIVAAMDVKTDRKVYKLAQIGAKLVSEYLGGNVRFQTLSEPFTNYCDGVFGPLFEEFPAGVAAISASEEERRRMFGTESYRAQFRKQWKSNETRVFHKDLGDMWIVSAPDASMVGKSFRQIAKEKGADEITLFMDLMRDHDRDVRWKTAVTNDRPGPRRELMASPYTLPGFNDSGAHNRNMAFQDGALQMLAQMQAHPETMTMERAVHRLTGETAAWFGLDVGTIAEGKVAGHHDHRSREATDRPLRADRARGSAPRWRDADGQAQRRGRASRDHRRARGVHCGCVREGPRHDALRAAASADEGRGAHVRDRELRRRGGVALVA